VIQHVALEVTRAGAEAEAAFWTVLGFAPVEPPPSLRERARWLQAGPTQVHLLYVEAPAPPRHGHVAVDAPEFAATSAALEAAGHAVDPRAEHWGVPRSYVRSPAGHLVEIMAAPP
jgi:catechol 2,3-dioxygenase-like lactoylglutathione lyase family enzyme